MNITDYRLNRRDVEMRAVGNGLISVFIPQYSPTTGERLPDVTGQINVQSYEAERQAAQDAVTRAQNFLDDVEAFFADGTKADDAFGKNEATAAKKKT